MERPEPRRAPLYEALVRHAAARPSSFHVPGHKHGAALSEEERAWFGRVTKIDLTELSGLDDLHQPEGAIREAQELAADCFGAERTFFLVGGSTAGNMAMILAACERGDLLLVQRNVHKSVLHGLMLAGARAVFLTPRIDEASGIAAGVDIGDVREALARYPEARGLLVTNPNYYGMADDLRALAELLHAHGKPLLVDEAHGAHFGLHPELPPSALSCGADAVVQSTHKMLTAMTMGAMLHLGSGSRLDASAVARLLAMLQSSSPSYPILASLDLARRRVHTAEGREAIGRGLAAAHRARQWLSEQPWCSLLEARRPAYGALDPFKLTVRDATGSLNGYDLQRELERRGCYPELATPRHALLAFSPASPLADADKLISALHGIAEEHGLRRLPPAAALPQAPSAAAPVSEPVRFDRTGLSIAAERVRPADAAGRRAAAMVVPYPPGIPVLYPGELITAGTAAYLAELAAAGARFHGAADGRLAAIEVLPET